jgi:SynChlorMet cassette radical SAM/SPASM protein ScmF
LTNPIREQVVKPLTQLNFNLCAGPNLACQLCVSPSPAAGEVRANGKHKTYPALPDSHLPPQAHVSPGCAAPFPQFMAVDIFQKSVSKALPLGLKSVKLLGAESCQHPKFTTLLAELESHALRISIETNGSGITPVLVERLARAACTVSIGLYGTSAASHDALSKRPGSFDTTARAVRLLADGGIPAQIIFTLTRQNFHQLQHMIDLAESLGANMVRFLSPIPHPLQTTASPIAHGNNGHTRAQKVIPLALNGLSEMLKVEELIAVGRRLERDIAVHTHLHVVFDQPPAFRGLSPFVATETLQRCSVLETLSIQPGGEVTLCGASQLVPALTLGQVGVETLEHIWKENPILLNLRANLAHSLQGICMRCSLRTSCMGHCIVQNFLESGSFWGPYWFCAAADRAGLFPASRLDE